MTISYNNPMMSQVVSILPSFTQHSFKRYLDQMDGELNDDIDIFENLIESGRRVNFK
ncbi:unnamed protein product (macronuclear) [Paramecium tetraurelia]|uniref:Uncharacterized protein n=1 Tax=Paramecium tetraurelia TaxID=5888 RepID=A0DU27_PARTE|nr:uncharacterized protein GSPATT00039770001 [Paramecium tetraurelia]CAK86544.1 unnamed protein product [Paramecium tetraurelia]|eukprot:XP_001453941.1 hypothetical protein (macronuclear) [Paramecium tetraurelia strain d4-2]